MKKINFLLLFTFLFFAANASAIDFGKLVGDAAKDVAKDAEKKATKVVKERLSKKYEDEDDDEEEEEINTAKAKKQQKPKKTAKPASNSAKAPVTRIDTVKVAIIETQTDAELPALAKEFKPSELSYITKEIRRVVTNNLPKTRFAIITEQSQAQEDMISLGEKLGADFIIKGVVSKFRKNYTFSVEIYDTGNGMPLTSSNPVGNEKVEDILSGFYEIAPDFFKRFEDEVKKIEDELNGSNKTVSTVSKKTKIKRSER